MLIGDIAHLVLSVAVNKYIYIVIIVETRSESDIEIAQVKQVQRQVDGMLAIAEVEDTAAFVKDVEVGLKERIRQSRSIATFVKIIKAAFGLDSLSEPQHCIEPIRLS